MLDDPDAPVRRSSAETALDSSVSRRTRAAFARDPRDRADEPVGGHDRRIDDDAVIGAGGDDDRLVEGARRLRDHLGGDAVVSCGNAGALLVVQEALEPDVLLQRGFVLDHLLLELLVLGAELLVLGARVEQILRPAVGVSERPRDAFGCDFSGCSAPATAPCASWSGPSGARGTRS